MRDPEEKTAFGPGLDAAIDLALAERRLVGTVVLVARDGALVYARAAGFADRAGARAVAEDTIFRLASVTKPITTATLMALVERGAVALSDPVTRFLPDFRPRMRNGREPVITIAQLLTHSSGLGYRFLKRGGSYEALGISDGLDQPGLSMAENLARLARAPLAFAPGAKWRYSLAIDVIGAVIEAASGMGFAEAVERFVTGPLALRDTAFRVTDPARLAVAYMGAAPEPRPMGDPEAVELWSGEVRFAPSRILDPASYPSGGAGMAGTAPEILRFLETIRSGGGEILRPETVALMMENHVRPDARTLGPGMGFGYGWAVLLDPVAAETPQSPGTISWGGVYGHRWFIDPAERLTVVALTNTAFEGMEGRFVTDVRDAIYEGLPALAG
ncbi:MAG: beta-lactamase family protein [Rhodobacteraceae bacterium]|nr:beta-lactamase family protein [Paracoccaceae bacterium]